MENLKDDFRVGRHAHAYLLAGALGVDKIGPTLELAKEITGAGDAGINPDLLVVSAEEGEKAISIGQIRELKKFFALEPYFGKNKAAVIDRFERAGPEASSAVLKILEEPPERSVIILTTDYPAMILPTILSRVQKIYLTGGALSDIDKRKEIFYDLTDIISADTVERFNRIEDMTKKNEEDTAELLEYWLSFFRDLAHLAAGGKKEHLVNAFYRDEMSKTLARKKYTPSAIARIIDEIIYWSFIARTTNANRRLILENIALLF